MLRVGSGTSSSGCVSLSTPRPPHVRQALSGLLNMKYVGRDVAVDEMMRRAAEPVVEAFGFRLARALDDVDLQQAVADQERAGNPGLDRLFVLPADDEPIDDRVHVARPFDSSSSTSAEMSIGLPSMISRRHPFFRTSVNTKSSSSP